MALTKLGVVKWCSFTMPNLLRSFSIGLLKHAKEHAMIPTISSSLASMDGLIVACMTSPLPKSLKVVILAQATAVASSPRDMRKQIRIFSVMLRCRVRTRRMGMSERVRSMVMYTANEPGQHGAV